MKKIIMIMIVSLAIASGAYAQKGRGYYRGHTRVIIAPAIGFTYGGFGYGYPYFNYGFGNPFLVILMVTALRLTNLRLS